MAINTKRGPTDQIITGQITSVQKTVQNYFYNCTKMWCQNISSVIAKNHAVKNHNDDQKISVRSLFQNNQLHFGMIIMASESRGLKYGLRGC